MVKIRYKVLGQFESEKDYGDVLFDGQTLEISFDSSNWNKETTNLFEIYVDNLLDSPYKITVNNEPFEDFAISDDTTNGQVSISLEPTEPIEKIVITGNDLIELSGATEDKIPDWIRSNAEWWASDQIDDNTFLSGIQFLIKEDMVSVDTKITTTIDDSNISETNNGYLKIHGKDFFIAEDQRINIKVSGQYLEYASHKGPIQLLLTEPPGHKDKIPIQIDDIKGNFSLILPFDHFSYFGEHSLKGIINGKDIGQVKFNIVSGHKPQEPELNNNNINTIPSWIKTNADWWSQGQLSDDDFLKGIQYLVEQRIIMV